MYGIVHQHHGWIDVESHPGRGAQFLIHLPAQDMAAAAPTAAPAPAPAIRGHERILVVEDEVAVRSLVCGVLNRLGYHLLRTGKAKEAIEIFKLNVESYPKSFNTYDSLAEAYMTINERELAIQNYKKSIELNPNNTGAIEALKRLEKGPIK